jgi:NAD(P)-dependent dehydrogenase (short-subunit alcohol dehydrogenase family)
MICTLTLLSSLRKRGGVIINIASRAATVDTHLALGYNDAKAAITRATHSLQLEFDLTSMPITTYALHPGGVATAMGSSGHRDQWLAGYDVFENTEEFKGLFRDGPELCGQVCAWLGAGRGKELRGMYLDCRQDLEVLLAEGRENLMREGNNVLGMTFCKGYKNEP